MAQNVPVKAEPVDEPSPMAADDDIYEDAGDLEFYDTSLPNDPFGSIYLAKVPPYVWAAWNKLDDDTEIKLGTIRQYMEVDKQGRQQNRMKLLLRSDLSQHQDVPKEYDLEFPPAPAGQPQNLNAKNTFIFSEAELPGYKAKNKSRQDLAAMNMPQHLLRAKERVEKPAQGHGYGRRSRQPFFRKPIPKKTAIYGRVRHELNATPVTNPESNYILNMRAKKQMEPKSMVEFGDPGNEKAIARMLAGQSLTMNDSLTNFLPTARAAAKPKKREVIKHARWPENDVLDAIVKAFDSFKYYHMSTLKKTIPQPEQWLRECLEKLANLNRSGRWANTWELKEEFRRETSATDDVVAKLEAGMDADDEDEDDDMEDVQIG